MIGISLQLSQHILTSTQQHFHQHPHTAPSISSKRLYIHGTYCYINRITMSASPIARAAALGTMPPPPLPERLRTGTAATTPSNQDPSNALKKSSRKPSLGASRNSVRGASTDPSKKSTDKTIQKKGMTRKQAKAAAESLLAKLEKAYPEPIREPTPKPPPKPKPAEGSEKEKSKEGEEGEKKKRKRLTPAQMLEAYDRWSVSPPSPRSNMKRFCAFLKLINRRQWQLLPSFVTSSLKFNGERISLYDFMLILKQEFGGGPEPTVQMEVLTSVGGEIAPNPPLGMKMKDAFIRDSIAARVAVKKLDSDEIEFTRHMIVHFYRGKISSFYDMREEAPRGRKKRAAKLSTLETPALRPPPPPVPVDLKKFYKQYIAAINLGPEKMAEAVPKFCKPTGVVHNGVHMQVDQYISLMQNATTNVAGLKFKIHTLLVDGPKQMIAARLDFKGTPVKTWMGASPTGDEVEWSEHVFYWLENSKISDVISIVDWESYREELGQ
ncbi:hypothetical protein QBC35DRAFT_497698 [Podospora australis]|uniref:Uncharacterized protein n=1 Tax=Podospora australis TaxID=1536484 RepID=A0AAN6WV89_9PEZI|nr:hypothetical protein QBC35DRAFT_497698 [Podospora australis]